MNLFTPEDLLEYYYQETSAEKSVAIADALKCDWTLYQKYEVICEAAVRLDKSIVSPRPEAIERILNYAAYAAPASV